VVGCLARLATHPERAPRGLKRPETHRIGCEDSQAKWACHPRTADASKQHVFKQQPCSGRSCCGREKTHIGTKSRQEDLQKLVNQEARLTLGAFRTTNQGALISESGLRPAPAQLDKRLRHFALRLTAFRKGSSQGAHRDTECARTTATVILGLWNGREETVLLEVATPLEATVTVDRQTGSPTCGPTGTNHLHGRLPPGNGATGYAVTWKKGNTWRGHKTHMGWGQEAYDAEYAAIERALREAASRDHALGTVTIFTET